VTTPALADLTGTYVLDSAHTRIDFVARHAMVTKVPGSFHEFEGTLHLDGSDPARSRASVSIAVGD
jgi:polyisoprenoid-binding protein YceI